MLFAEVQHGDSVRNDVSDQRARGLRDQDLAAYARGGDPCRTYHVQPEVALVANVRLTRVKPHADAHLASRGPAVAAQCALGRDRTGERVTGTRERVEERVALRVDLGAAGSPEGLSHDPPVIPRDDRIGLVP